MKRLICIVTLLVLVNIAFASDIDSLFVKANNEYVAQLYSNAVEDYEKIIAKGYASAELYYNLGNSYYKLNEIPSAILYYEKAKKLDPKNDDIEFNLNVANTKIVDKIEPVPELFIWQWWRGLYDLFSADTWTKISISLFILFFILLAFYLLSRVLIIRKTAFYAGLIVLFLTVFTFFISWQRYTVIANEKDAIVFTPTITVKSSPSENSVDLFVIHEGSKVRIIQKVGTWCEIKIANGSVGWLPITSLKNI